MNTITLTMEATPENLKKLAEIFGEAEKPMSIAEGKKAIKKAAKPEPELTDPTVPEMEPPKMTITALRELGLKLTKAGKQEELRAALKEVGATKLSQVKQEDFDELGKKLQEALS